MTSARPYASPYVAGVALGLVLLAAYALTGQGLGASGAFANAASGLVAAVAPAQAAKNSYFQSYLGAGAPWSAWIVLEIAGVIVGGAVSARLAGRFATRIETGPRLSKPTRLATATAGGMIMGLGAVLARGCTSGQALSGGALLSVGSWAFMIAVFIAGYAAAPLCRRLWR
ncbi:YeeE/YedE thiosulfate transporter family protein [Phenylobacterium sp.]|uniref:YeeE/YedE thiosulfate transporter family protein n=1 Tax=Phenylobacterium sp. TaxID=1871053 RepID=UPI002CFCE69D|nr:YeeE/YedE thiosulfate transporter family protein [Phenylobacterium sp.]HLZ74078.1 YeeE/YedE thiosulfate transporter family protein [Phenylobacterium sp.]